MTADVAGARCKPIVAVVDDDPATRASIADLLESAGYRSEAFDSGERFIASGALETMSLVITDIQMGRLSGLDLLDRLGETSRSPIPVIVITALTEERLESRAVGAGCFAFLRKPFDPETLLDHVKAAIER